MWLTFSEYCRQQQFREMAQAKDPGVYNVFPDEKDKDFIDQAVSKGISPVSALRTRYTLLLSDPDIGESGPVRFFGSGRVPFKTVHIDRTHLQHLRDKLKALGMEHASKYGFHPYEEMDPANASDYYHAAFSRQNADYIMKGNAKQWGSQSIDVNRKVKTGRKFNLDDEPTPIGAESEPMTPAEEVPAKKKRGRNKETLGGTEEPMGSIAAQTIAPTTEPATEPTKPKSSFTTKLVPEDWALKFRWSHHGDKERDSRWHHLDNLHGSHLYDFSDVWDAVRTLVGVPGEEEDKYIHPVVWRVFEKKLPMIGQAIYNGLKNRLVKLNYGSDILSNVPELKQLMMQVTANILSDPIPAGVRNFKPTGDTQADLNDYFGDNKRVALRAQSEANTNVLRKWGYTSKDDTMDVVGMGGRTAGASGIATGSAVVDQQGKDSPKADSETEAELDILRQMADQSNAKGTTRIHRIIQKVKDADDNPSLAGLSDEEWELYQHYKRLEKEMEHRKQRGRQYDPDEEEVKLDLGTGARQDTGYGRRLTAARREPGEQPPPKDRSRLDRLLQRSRERAAQMGVQREVAGATGTLGPLDTNNPDYQVEGDPCSQVILGFNAWCKRREKRGDGTGSEKKKGWDGVK